MMAKSRRLWRWIAFVQMMFITPVALNLPAQNAQEDYCLFFSDGQYAEVASRMIPLGSDFTLAMWIYDTGDGSNFAEYVSQGQQPGPFYLGTTAGSNNIRAGDAWVDTGYVMPRNRWVHLALTSSKARKGALYIDGHLVRTNDNYSFGSGGTPTRLGSQFGTPSEFFSGCIDELKIYKSVRTAGQISNDMQKNTATPTDANLIAYYDFNDRSDEQVIHPVGGGSANTFELAYPAKWTLASPTLAKPLAVSSEIGLSICADGNCGAYFYTDGLQISPGFENGYSWYSAVWPLLTDVPDRQFQMGLGSSWLTPDLRPYEGRAALNNAIREICGDFGADRGNGQWILFQSIEGGLGYWGDTQFKSAMPKWRFNATSNCYHSLLGSPGWPTGKTTPLEMDETALVQLSNRMLIAPDGQTFPLDTNGELLGVTWVALPFPQVAVASEASPTGPNAWTLFMNSANFKGPLAYWMPQYFSDVAQEHRSLAPYGLDSNPGLIVSMASEMGWVSMVEGLDVQGITYSRIPQLRFHVNSQGRSILSQDVRAYSERAVADRFSSWLGSTTSFGPFSTSSADVQSLALRISYQPDYYQHHDLILGLSQQLRIAAFDNGTSFGVAWTDLAATGNFPAYFRDEGSNRRIISEAEVPAETGLRDFQFRSADRVVSYQPASWWAVETMSIPGGTVTLSDGSTVEYVWFKFVDQPALRRLNLSAADREALQSMVERIHREWSISDEYMAQPSSGQLVPFDPALIVTPPTGYEYGYVPIVISQTGSSVGPPLK